LALAAALIAMAGLGWAIGNPGKLAGLFTSPVTSTTASPAAVAPPSAAVVVPPPEPATGPTSAAPDDLIPVPEIPSAGQSVTELKFDSAATAESSATEAVAHYGHGGANTRQNRIRMRVESESAATALAREEARQHNLAAALAITQMQASASAAATEASAPEKKKRRSFACAVFNKCDPPKATEAPPNTGAPPTPPTQPVQDATKPASNGG
jgi:hypothetical protein